MPFGKTQLTRHTCRVTGAALVLAVVAGCSSNEPIEEPDPRPEISGNVDIDAVWTATVGDGHDGGFLHLEPWIAGNSLYAVSADGDLLALNPDDGERKWRRDLDQRIMAGVGGDGRNLYVVTRDARLQAYARRDGELLWEAELPQESLAAPQSNGNVVMAQTIDGQVLAYDPRSGERLWRFEGSSQPLSLRATAKPLLGRDLALVSFPNGQLIALSTADGEPEWEYVVGEPSGRTELERLVDVTSQPLVLDNAALVTGYQGKLAAINLENGQEFWSRRVSTLHTPAIGGNNLIFLSEANGDVTALRGQDRVEVWKQEDLSWRQLTAPIVVGDYLLVGDFEGYLHALSVDDGELQGQREVDDEGLRVPMKPWGDGVIVYGNGGRLGLLELNERE